MKDEEKTVSDQPAVQRLDEETLDQVVAGNPTLTQGSTASGAGSSAMLSSVSKTRSEISATFARNARA